jgi:CRP-like cAMP-binding protein
MQGGVATAALLVVAGKLGTEIRLELVGVGQLLLFHEMLVSGPSPLRIVAEKDTDVLEIPSSALLEALDTAPTLARDISALIEARRQAIIAAQRGIRRDRGGVGAAASGQTHILGRTMCLDRGNAERSCPRRRQYLERICACGSRPRRREAPRNHTPC